MSAPPSASPLGTPRIYAARYGYAVRWLTVRTARTLEEAEALAAMPVPPTRRWPPRSSVKAETIRIACELRDAGRSFRAVAEELDRRGIRPPRARLWSPSTVARLVR